MANLYRFSYRVTFADNPEDDEIRRGASKEQMATRFPWLLDVFIAPEPGLLLDMTFGRTRIRIVDDQYPL